LSIEIFAKGMTGLDRRTKLLICAYQGAPLVKQGTFYVQT